jgi:hypothetical protein
LASREKHSTFSDLSVVTLRQSFDESVSIGLSSSVDDTTTTFFRRLVLKTRTNESVFDVASDSGSEKSGFLQSSGKSVQNTKGKSVRAIMAYLRDETDLVAKPCDVEVLDLDTVKFDTSSNRIAVVRRRKVRISRGSSSSP